MLPLTRDNKPFSTTSKKIYAGQVICSDQGVICTLIIAPANTYINICILLLSQIVAGVHFKLTTGHIWFIVIIDY